MYKILVGVDQNEDRARAQAREIVNMPLDHDEVEVMLLHAFEDNPSGATVAQVGAVRRIQEILEEAGIDPILEEAGAKPAEAITTFADREDADLIVVAGRKRTPTGKVLFGSVTQAVILETDRAVLVCTASEDR